ncbi:hypothetical protein HDU92_005160 [Lobulomyces angularis]|nr:hypothetical protein HDU92_005160 [Lobulomyces angularis]
MKELTVKQRLFLHKKRWKKLIEKQKCHTKIEHFHSQVSAFEYMKSFSFDCQLTLKAFSYEFDSSKPGKRKFLVATIDQFWNYYKRLLENSRHFYEIICEDVSSKLYFDVEYEINDYNKNLNSTELIGIFKNEVLKELNFQFKLENLEQDEVILDLDSSTSEKFSRHLIFNIPGHIFKNNYVVGNLNFLL